MVAAIGDGPMSHQSPCTADWDSAVGTLEAVGFKFDRRIDSVLIQRSLTLVITTDSVKLCSGWDKGQYLVE